MDVRDICKMRGFVEECTPPPNNKNVECIFKNSVGEKIIVFIFGERSVGISTIRDVYATIGTKYMQTIIVCNSISSIAHKHALNQTVHCCFIKPHELLVPYMQHPLCPKHRLCTPGEEQNLVETFKTDPDTLRGMLPKILVDDVMVRIHGFSIGDIVAIDRYRTNTYFRCVVAV